MGKRRGARVAAVAVAVIALANVSAAAGASAAGGGPARVLAPNHPVPAPPGGRTAAGIAALGWSSSNWSGYAVTSGAPYTRITGVWIVPRVGATSSPSFSAAWIGIDGFANNSLIQAGTEEDYYLGGARYSAWWTTSDFGFLEQPIPSMTIHPGDLMFSLIGQIAPGAWIILLVDATTGQSFVKVTPYNGPGASAEWILEAPSVGGSVAQLAHYGATLFDAGTVNGQSPAFVPSNGGTLVQNGAVVSYPSDPDVEPPPGAPDGFGVAYGATQPPPPHS